MIAKQKKELYPQGRLGNYSLDLKEAEKFEQHLKSWNFQREKGDAILIVADLMKEVIS